MQTTTQATPGANGSAPSGPVAAAAELLAERLGELDAQMRELEALRAEHRQVTSALRVIAPEHPRLEVTGKPGPKAKPAKPAGTWRPGQRKLDDALEALRALGKPARVNDVADRAGMARETARKALEALRDDELVRVAGTETGPGGARKLYALMPED